LPWYVSFACKPVPSISPVHQFCLDFLSLTTLIAQSSSTKPALVCLPNLYSCPALGCMAQTNPLTCAAVNPTFPRLEEGHERHLLHMSSPCPASTCRALTPMPTVKTSCYRRDIHVSSALALPGLKHEQSGPTLGQGRRPAKHAMTIWVHTLRPPSLAASDMESKDLGPQKGMFSTAT
jgi:hypothetical protein